jgi:aminoacrylate hydrolase
MTVFDVHDGPRLDAETVLLSSGLGGAAGYWTPQLEALKQHYRVIAYDQGGTGRSGGTLPPAGYSIAAMADEVVGVLDDSGTATAHFVGHALGGLIGLELARRQPQRLRSLTVANGWAAAQAHTKRCFELRLMLLKHEGPAAYVRAQPIFLYPADWLARNEARAAQEEAHGLAHFQGEANLRARIAALLAFDARAVLDKLTLPTLIVAARDDVLVPCVASEELAAAIPGARLHVAPWGGHAINVTEQATFDSVLLDFLSPVTR